MIVALAGRRIDKEGARPPRFPLANLEFVRQRLHDLLQEEAVTALVSSAACGADLLALSEADAIGIRCRVVLPFDRVRFRETSVLDRPGDWRFYDSIIDKVTANNDLITLAASSDEQRAYEAANRAILDEAQALGRATREEVRVVLVWDGRSRGPGDLTEAFGVAAKQKGLTKCPRSDHVEDVLCRARLWRENRSVNRPKTQPGCFLRSDQGGRGRSGAQMRAS